MKKTAQVIALVILIAAAIAAFMYPNIVTGIPPVRNMDEATKKKLDSVANAKDKEAALKDALKDFEHEHGRTLEERVAWWAGVSKYDSMRFFMVNGPGITAYDAEHKEWSGYAHNEVLVRIYNAGTHTDYFLKCANGLVRKVDALVSEEPIGGNHVAPKPVTSVGSLASSPTYVYRTIQKGGSLWKTLDIRDRKEELDFSNKNKLKHWYSNGKLIVIIPEGSTWRMIGDSLTDQWTRVQYSN